MHHAGLTRSHGQHLADSTGLETTGHQEQVTGPVKQVGKRFRVALEVKKIVVAAGNFNQTVFQGPVTTTQHDKNNLFTLAFQNRFKHRVMCSCGLKK